jgi:hypothetical protein
LAIYPFLLGEGRSLGFTVDVLLFNQGNIFGVSEFIAIVQRVQDDAKICARFIAGAAESPWINFMRKRENSLLVIISIVFRQE